jgi:hypothetical protein
MTPPRSMESAAHDDEPSSAAQTSVGDRKDYRSVCAEASRNDELFGRFKADARYRKVLEHVTPEQGRAYLALAHAQTPDLFRRLDVFRQNDRLGGPLTADYGPPVGVLSPTTCRYIKVLSDLQLMFGDLTGKHLVELGGGYGGQCFILSMAFRLASYTMVDLRPVLDLQRRYLQTLGLDTINYVAPDDLPAAGLQSDLFLSNYALTECLPSTCDRYIRLLSSRATRGYVTGNWINPRCYDRQQLMAHLPHAIGLPEVPRTGRFNYLLVWNAPSSRASSALEPFDAGLQSGQLPG